MPKEKNIDTQKEQGTNSPNLLQRLGLAEKEGARTTLWAMAYNALHIVYSSYNKSYNNLKGRALACGEYFVKNGQTEYVDPHFAGNVRGEGRA